MAATETECANKQANTCFWESPWLSFDYITSDSGRNQLAFKLTNLFPNPSLLPLSDLDPFPRLDSPPLTVAILAPTGHAPSGGLSPAGLSLRVCNRG